MAVQELAKIYVGKVIAWPELTVNNRTEIEIGRRPYRPSRILIYIFYFVFPLG